MLPRDDDEPAAGERVGDHRVGLAGDEHGQHAAVEHGDQRSTSATAWRCGPAANAYGARQT